jgi:hypothetical protein
MPAALDWLGATDVRPVSCGGAVSERYEIQRDAVRAGEVEREREPYADSCPINAAISPHIAATSSLWGSWAGRCRPWQPPTVRTRGAISAIEAVAV